MYIILENSNDWMKRYGQKCPKNGGLPYLRPPRFFFKNLALSLLYPYGALTSCKKLEKNEQSLIQMPISHDDLVSITLLEI